MIRKVNPHWEARLASYLFTSMTFSRCHPTKPYLPFKGPQATVSGAMDKGMFFSCSFADHVLLCISE